MACNWAIGTSSFNPAYTTASCPVKLITKVPLAMTEVPATEPIWSKCKKPNDLSCAILGLFPRFSSQGLLSTLRGGCTKTDCREEDVHSKRFPHLGWIIRYKPKQQQGIRRSRLGSQPALQQHVFLQPECINLERHSLSHQGAALATTSGVLPNHFGASCRKPAKWLMLS